MYGKIPIGTGIAALPLTGNNSILFIAAATLIAVGVTVFAVSLVLARKNRQASEI
ncbi:MAG TPA: hypothetical protein VK497_01235 [Candidatus Saccharimonadales bacterium]|nr:hypothetical protein [Candidatus Saccharimonadales bacterium]